MNREWKKIEFQKEFPPNATTCPLRLCGL